MKFLLLVAHGSRRQASNQEIHEIAEKISEGLPLYYEGVQVAFLEFSSPSIDDALNSCLSRGAKEIVVLPFFLSAGQHVVNDIPSQIQKTMQTWPHTKVTMLSHIGAASEMVKVIERCSTEPFK